MLCTYGISEILSADDTLIVDERGDLAQTYMDCIVDKGRQYGLKFNWDKVQYITIGCAPALAQPNGSNVKRVDSITYLGALLIVDCKSAFEIAKKKRSSNMCLSIENAQ